MSKKFENIVNAPHRAFGRARDKLIYGKWPQGGKQRAVRVGKITFHTLMQFITWATKYLVLDNHLTRKLEKGLGQVQVKDDKGNKTNIKKFKNPNAVAHLIYYAMIFATAAGVDLSQDDSVIKETVKEWIADLTGKNKLENLVINPALDDTQWKQQMDAISPYVLAHLFSTEGYIENAYYDDEGGGTLTFGAGFTINDKSHRDFAKKILGRPVGNGATISVEETRLLTQAWCQEKIYPKMKRQFTVPMPAKTFISLVVTAFNAGENTFANGNSGAPVRDAVNSGKSTEEVANLLVKQFGKIRNTQWGGMPNKYAVCALYMTGKISDDAILNAISEAPYTLESVLKKDSVYLSKFDAKTMEKGRLLVYDSGAKKSRASGIVEIENINQVLQQQQYRVTKGTQQKPVKDYMTEYEVQVMREGKLYHGADLDFTVAEKKSKKQDVEVSASEKLNEEGEAFFFDGKYKQAIEKFEEALKEDPKNYIVYSNLSIAYYKNHDYQKGLQVVQGLIQSKYFEYMPDNIKAYTYYNAALCREKLGDKATSNSTKQEHYVKAKQNIELAKQKSGQSYDGFVSRLNKKLGSGKNKKMAFNYGVKQVRQKNAMHDVLIYGEERTIA